MNLTGNKCECTACGQFFNRVSTFDKHRVGTLGASRRCLSVDEMAAKGWRLNDKGFWLTEARALPAAWAR